MGTIASTKVTREHRLRNALVTLAVVFAPTLALIVLGLSRPN